MIMFYKCNREWETFLNFHMRFDVNGHDYVSSCEPALQFIGFH